MQAECLDPRVEREALLAGISDDRFGDGEVVTGVPEPANPCNTAMAWNYYKVRTP